jgi:hypothetical protein
MTTAQPSAVVLPMEARANITQHIAELQIAADTALAGLEMTPAATADLAPVTLLVRTIGESVFLLARQWNALLALADAPKGGAE